MQTTTKRNVQAMKQRVYGPTLYTHACTHQTGQHNMQQTIFSAPSRLSYSSPFVMTILAPTALQFVNSTRSHQRSTHPFRLIWL